MKVHVIFAQRIQRYGGEYGLEALAVASEADVHGNPEYLPGELEKYQATKEFESLAIVALEVSECEIRSILKPTGIVKAAVIVPAPKE